MQRATFALAALLFAGHVIAQDLPPGVLLLSRCTAVTSGEAGHRGSGANEGSPHRARLATPVALPGPGVLTSHWAFSNNRLSGPRGARAGRTGRHPASRIPIADTEIPTWMVARSTSAEESVI